MVHWVRLPGAPPLKEKMMKVKELIELLQKVPEDADVDFLGYGMGSTFFERVRPEDFIYSEDQKTLVIKADWN